MPPNVHSPARLVVLSTPLLLLLAAGACTKEHPLDDLLDEDAGQEEEGEPDEGELDASEPDDEDAGKPEGRRDAGTSGRDARVAACPEPGSLPVDLLFMIDNSGSMGEEQKKLASVLPQLVAALATGNADGRPAPAGSQPDSPPVTSLHVGVVSSDMGINGSPAPNSCGDRSFLSTEHDTRMTTTRINKPVGDDGILQTDVSVAVDGIWGPGSGTSQVTNFLPADPSCQGITFPPDRRFVELSEGGDVAAASLSFSCIAKRGRNGCGLEQQLEAVLKALTPPDSNIKFTAQSPNGHGDAEKPANPSGFNQNFLREDAILAVVVVTDEEDCSIPDNSRGIFDPNNQKFTGGINVRCGLQQNASYLHPVARYVDGLKALKPKAYQDRIIFTGIVGIPLSQQTGAKAHSGETAMNALLNRPDMLFMTRRNQANTDDEPVPSCVSETGDGSAAPGRRYLEVAKEFGENGLVTSICEDEYASVLQLVREKVASIQAEPGDCP